MDRTIIEWIRSKYHGLANDVNERGQRRWVAVEALSLGRGGISAVATATGISDRTLRNGIRELRTGDSPPQGDQRRKGGGRKRADRKNPALCDALQSLVEPVTRGDPMSPWKWICRSPRDLATAPKASKHSVSHATVAKLLQELGDSLQANRKTIEGQQHPDRNAQFEHIARRVAAQQRAGQPALSVDTQKTCTLGHRPLGVGDYRQRLRRLATRSRN